MSSASRAWSVAATVGVVETLKDQGFWRWNYTFEAAQHVKSHVRSLSQAKKLSSSAAAVSRRLKDEKAKQSEESLKEGHVLELLGSQLNKDNATSFVISSLWRLPQKDIWGSKIFGAILACIANCIVMKSCSSIVIDSCVL